MGGRQHHLRCKARLGGDSGRQRPHHRSRHGQRSEQRPGQPQTVQQLSVPAAVPGVDQAGAGGVGVLLLFHPGEQVVEIVGDHQQASGPGQLVRVFGLKGRQLVDGVEALLLDAGVCVQLRRRDQALHHGVHPLGTAVPVRHRVPQQPSFRVQQHKVHRPGVDADGGRDLSTHAAGLQPRQDPLPQQLQIPAVVAVSAHLPVCKPVHLLQDHSVPFQPAKDAPSAGRPNVDGQMIIAHKK